MATFADFTHPQTPALGRGLVASLPVGRCAPRFFRDIKKIVHRQSAPSMSPRRLWRRLQILPTPSLIANSTQTRFLNRPALGRGLVASLPVGRCAPRFFRDIKKNSSQAISSLYVSSSPPATPSVKRMNLQIYCKNQRKSKIYSATPPAPPFHRPFCRHRLIFNFQSLIFNREKRIFVSQTKRNVCNPRY